MSQALIAMAMQKALDEMTRVVNNYEEDNCPQPRSSLLEAITELRAAMMHLPKLLKEDEMDATRYRWLRRPEREKIIGRPDDPPGLVDLVFVTTEHGFSLPKYAEELDAAIDAAIARDLRGEMIV